MSYDCRMKVYVAARFNGDENRNELKKLCAAVKAANMKDFCFVRDVTEKFDDPKDLWSRVYDELNACDALLVDVSDLPAGGRLVEVGMAYAMRKRVFVIVRRGVNYKPLFDGIASTIIEYENYKDITSGLKKYADNTSFDVTDKTMLFGIMVFIGLAGAWGLAQYFIPLGFGWLLFYWWGVRRFMPSMKIFDRVAIYIPLTALWLVGTAMLYSIHEWLGWSWALMFWFVVLAVLKKLKFTL